MGARASIAAIQKAFRSPVAAGWQLFPLEYSPPWGLRMRRPRAMLDLHGRRMAGRQNHALGHLIDMDTHRDALCQKHPRDDRVHGLQSLRADFRIGAGAAYRDDATLASTDTA